MKLYLMQSWRNLWRHRRRTLIVISAIALVLTMMILYDGMMAGFDQAVYGNAVKIYAGNIQVHALGYRAQVDQNPLLPLPDDQAVVQVALAQPQVVAASRRINTGGLATSREGAFAVGITAIEPEAEAKVNLAARNVTAGRFLTADDGDVVFIGMGLAQEMGVGVGDRITLVGRSTHQQMRQRTMTVVGIYDLGMTDVEKQFVYISLLEGQTLYDLSGQSTEVTVTLAQLGQEAAVLTALRPALSGYEIDSWETNFPELRAAIRSKDGVMNIMSMVIMLIAGIGILNMLLMAVYERMREIGVLGALGLKPRQIRWLFLLEGLMMGMVGVAAGIIFGLLCNAILRQVGVDYSAYTDVASFTALIDGRIYPTWGLNKIVFRTLTMASIAVLAALIPAGDAASREPAQALHYV